MIKPDNLYVNASKNKAFKVKYYTKKFSKYF